MGDWQCALDPENVADQERTASRRLENRRVPGGSVSAPLQIALHAPSPERDCDRPSLSPNRAMPLATPLTTFGDLARDYLEIEVTCGNCGHRRTIDAASPRQPQDRRSAVPAGKTGIEAYAAIRAAMAR